MNSGDIIRVYIPNGTVKNVRYNSQTTVQVNGLFFFCVKNVVLTLLFLFFFLNYIEFLPAEWVAKVVFLATVDTAVYFSTLTSTDH